MNRFISARVRGILHQDCLYEYERHGHGMPMLLERDNKIKMGLACTTMWLLEMNPVETDTRETTQLVYARKGRYKRDSSGIVSRPRSTGPAKRTRGDEMDGD
jgi:hypothetical protein